MSMNKEKQLQVIDAFYHDFLSYRPESLGIWFGAGFLAVIYGIYMWVPWANHTEPLVDALMLFLGFFAPYLYLTPYRVYRDPAVQGNTYNTCNILDMLCYLPVDRYYIRYYRLKKHAKFCVIAGAIYVAGQLLFSIVFAKELTISCVVFALVAGFVWPFASCADLVAMILEKRK